MRLGIATCVTVIGLLQASAASFAQDASAPSFFRINNIRAQGDGCPADSIALNIASDQQAYTVSFSQFVAEVNGATPTMARKACRLVFDTEHEAGWEFAVVGVIFRGAAFLDPQVNARLDVRFSGGRGRDGQGALNLQGPVEKDYVHAEDVPLEAARWSGCRPNEHRTKDAVVNSSLVLSSSLAGAHGLMTVDSVDGQIKQVYDLAWRRCDGKGPRSIAVCRIEDGQRRGGSSRGFNAQGQGRTPELALSKAKARLARRCGELGQGLGRCDVNMARCEAKTL